MRPEEVLGLQPGASLESCRAAYRRLVREHHPDHHPEATPAERQAHAAALQRIMAAWAELSRGEGDAVLDTAEGDELLDDAMAADDLDGFLGADADQPLSGATLGRVPAVVPMALVAASFATFCISVVLSHSALWQAAVGLGALALLSFILVPFFVMLRGHR